MVYGPHALVLDAGASAGEREAGGAIPAAVGRGTDGGDVGCGGGGAALEPDYHAFPIVTMAETSRRSILREIPDETELC